MLTSSVYKKNKGGTSYKSRYNRRLRIEAIRKYGGKCCQCGFCDWRALQFDHVEGGGNQHAHSMSRELFYQEIMASFGTNKFQLLCANCNTIKRFEEAEGVGTEANAVFLKAMEEQPLEISLC